jgi:opacity protein-like surface antigen
VLGSIYGGVDYQILLKAIVDVPAEATQANISGTNSACIPGASVTSQANFDWAVLARAGILANSSTLIYFTGGYVSQNFLTSDTDSASGSKSSFSQSNTFNGWIVGSGFEAMLGCNCATKLEHQWHQHHSVDAHSANGPHLQVWRLWRTTARRRTGLQRPGL